MATAPSAPPIPRLYLRDVDPAAMAEVISVWSGDMASYTADELARLDAGLGILQLRALAGFDLIGRVDLTGSTGAAVTIPATYRSVRIHVGGAVNGVGAVQTLVLQVQIGGVWLTATAAIYYDQRLYNSQTAGVLQQPLIDQPGGLFVGYVGANAFNGVVELTNMPAGQCGAFIDSISWDGGAGFGWLSLTSRSLINAATRIEAVRIINTAGAPRNFTAGSLIVTGILA